MRATLSVVVVDIVVVLVSSNVEVLVKNVVMVDITTFNNVYSLVVDNVVDFSIVEALTGQIFKMLPNLVTLVVVAPWPLVMLNVVVDKMVSSILAHVIIAAKLVI